MLATKGGVTMYDYMKALQERFDEKQPEQLVYAVQAVREGLRNGIDAENCFGCWTHRTRCWSKPS